MHAHACVRVCLRVCLRVLSCACVCVCVCARARASTCLIFASCYLNLTGLPYMVHLLSFSFHRKYAKCSPIELEEAQPRYQHYKVHVRPGWVTKEHPEIRTLPLRDRLFRDRSQVRVSTHSTFGHEIWGMLDPEWRLIPKDKKVFIKRQQDHKWIGNHFQRKTLISQDLETDKTRAVLQDKEYLVPLTIIFDDVRTQRQDDGGGLADIWEKEDHEHVFCVSEWRKADTNGKQLEELQQQGKILSRAKDEFRRELAALYKEITQGQVTTQIRDFKTHFTLKVGIRVPISEE